MPNGARRAHKEPSSRGRRAERRIRTRDAIAPTAAIFIFPIKFALALRFPSLPFARFAKSGFGNRKIAAAERNDIFTISTPSSARPRNDHLLIRRVGAHGPAAVAKSILLSGAWNVKSL